MKFEILSNLEGEIAHHYDTDGDFINSKGNLFFGLCNNIEFSFRIPIEIMRGILSNFRETRRLFRFDKSNAVLNYKRDSVIVFYAGAGWRYELSTGQLSRTFSFRQCRNALHQGVCVSASGLFVGEYGSNPKRQSVPIWGSYDDGRTWKIVWEFPAGKVRHIHGIYSDPYTDEIWITTGDKDGESYLVKTDARFEDFVFLGDGSQPWRAVSLIFREDSIFWGMDSPLQDCYFQGLDRSSRKITPIRHFEGPIWYTKALLDGSYLLQTTVEIGPGVKSFDSHVYVSEDLREWERLCSFRKDAWPMPYFKYGVVGFADGRQDKSDFVMFGEGLKGLDGRIIRAGLV